MYLVFPHLFLSSGFLRASLSSSSVLGLGWLSVVVWRLHFTNVSSRVSWRVSSMILRIRALQRSRMLCRSPNSGGIKASSSSLISSSSSF